MKNKLFGFAITVAALGVTGHFFAKPLMAAVAALTKNIDERGRNPYYQQVVCYNASGNTCYAFFPAVPAGMRLVVEHINMSIDTATAFSAADIAGNGGIIEQPLLTVQGQDSSGHNIYVANQPFLMYYEAGQTPEVSIFSQAGGSAFMSGQATLTGYLVNLNQ
ncbi:MAG: hypothetical protein JO097_20510 [Acidobacteriaceae bacterium]|nr:hypothetical protein [Acidobacteriaceae bacterium]